MKIARSCKFCNVTRDMSIPHTRARMNIYGLNTAYEPVRTTASQEPYGPGDTRARAVACTAYGTARTALLPAFRDHSRSKVPAPVHSARCSPGQKSMPIPSLSLTIENSNPTSSEQDRLRAKSACLQFSVRSFILTDCTARAVRPKRNNHFAKASVPDFARSPVAGNIG